MTSSSTDRIEKRIELAAPVARVWRALTDHREFSAWFGVRLEEPFGVGKRSHGNITYAGMEHLVMEVWVTAMEAPKRFAFEWHPYAVDPKKDYAHEPRTLVEFFLEKAASGTVLRVVESGFDKVPLERRAEAFRMNDQGWHEQTHAIQKFLRENP